MKQNAFTKEFAEELELNIESHLDLYTQAGGNFEQKDIVSLQFDKPDGLLDSMLPYLSSEAKIEVDAAIRLYEAFKDLTPLEASYSPFWCYLSHVDLYPYMYKRWIEGQDVPADKMVDHINAHWFYKNGKLRNHLEGMYWLVRQSVVYDEQGWPDYTYTRFLFSRRVLGDRGIAARQFIFANDKVFKGVLDYIMKNENTIFAHHMQARATYCASLLNTKGAVVELSTWNEKDVEKFLDMHKDKIVLQNND